MFGLFHIYLYLLCLLNLFIYFYTFINFNLVIFYFNQCINIRYTYNTTYIT